MGLIKTLSSIEKNRYIPVLGTAKQSILSSFLFSIRFTPRNAFISLLMSKPSTHKLILLTSFNLGTLGRRAKKNNPFKHKWHALSQAITTIYSFSTLGFLDLKKLRDVKLRKIVKKVRKKVFEYCPPFESFFEQNKSTIPKTFHKRKKTKKEKDAERGSFKNLHVFELEANAFMDFNVFLRVKSLTSTFFEFKDYFQNRMSFYRVNTKEAKHPNINQAYSLVSDLSKSLFFLQKKLLRFRDFFVKFVLLKRFKINFFFSFLKDFFGLTFNKNEIVLIINFLKTSTLLSLKTRKFLLKNYIFFFYNNNLASTFSFIDNFLHDSFPKSGSYIQKLSTSFKTSQNVFVTDALFLNFRAFLLARFYDFSSLSFMLSNFSWRGLFFGLLSHYRLYFSRFYVAFRPILRKTRLIWRLFKFYLTFSLKDLDGFITFFKKFVKKSYGKRRAFLFRFHSFLHHHVSKHLQKYYWKYLSRYKKKKLRYTLDKHLSSNYYETKSNLLTEFSFNNYPVLKSFNGCRPPKLRRKKKAVNTFFFKRNTYQI